MSIKQMEKDLNVVIKGLLCSKKKTVVVLEKGIQNIDGTNLIYSNGCDIVITEEYIFVQEV